MSNTEPNEKSSFPECTPEQYERVRSFAEPTFAAAGHKLGEQIPVIIGGEIRIYTYLGNTSGHKSETIPNCPVDFCKRIRESIDQYCHAVGYPPGTPIPCIDEQGEICYCYCM